MDDPWEQQDEPMRDPLVERKGLLFRRAVRGGYWILALQIVTQLLALGKTVLLARLLIKVDMGLLGVALLATDTLKTFSNTGFNTALVQRRDDIRSYLDTAWSIHVIRGVLLFIVLFAAAPVLASIKVPTDKAATAVSIIRAMACVFLLSGFSNIGQVYFTKELDFRRVFIWRTACVLVDIIVAVILLLILRSVWAYVWGRLAACVTSVALSYLLHPHRPRFSIDLQKAREMWRYGRWISVMTILVFLVTSGDDYFVWGYLGVASLAVYQMAYRFSNLPAAQATAVLTQIAFPAFSKLQGDLPRLREAYLKVLSVTSFLALPLAGGIIVLASEFVHVFLTDKWSAVSPVLQVLTIKGALRATGGIRGTIFQATGRPDVMTRLQLARVIWLVVLIYPLTAGWGLVGTAWAITIGGLAVLPFELHRIAKILRCSTWHSVVPLIVPLVSTGVMMTAVAVAKPLVPMGSSAAGFLAGVLWGLMVYLVVVFVLDARFDRRIWSALVEQRQMLTGTVRSKWNDWTQAPRNSVD